MEYRGTVEWLLQRRSLFRCHFERERESPFFSWPSFFCVFFSFFSRFFVVFIVPETYTTSLCLFILSVASPNLFSFLLSLSSFVGFSLEFFMRRIFAFHTDLHPTSTEYRYLFTLQCWARSMLARTHTKHWCHFFASSSASSSTSTLALLLLFSCYFADLLPLFGSAFTIFTIIIFRRSSCGFFSVSFLRRVLILLSHFTSVAFYFARMLWLRRDGGMSGEKKAKLFHSK